MRSPLHEWVETEAKRLRAEMAAEAKEDARFERYMKLFLIVAVPAYALLMIGLLVYLFRLAATR